MLSVRRVHDRSPHCYGMMAKNDRKILLDLSGRNILLDSKVLAGNRCFFLRILLPQKLIPWAFKWNVWLVLAVDAFYLLNCWDWPVLLVFWFFLWNFLMNFVLLAWDFALVYVKSKFTLITIASSFTFWERIWTAHSIVSMIKGE